MGEGSDGAKASDEPNESYKQPAASAKVGGWVGQAHAP